MSRVASPDEIQAFLIHRGLTTTDAGAREVVADGLGVGASELDEFFGDGPLSTFLVDPEVTEVLVNGYKEIWVEKAGRLHKTRSSFSSEGALKRYVRRLLSGSHRKVDHLNPFADCMTADGHRVHAVIPPIARGGICLSVRKSRPGGWTLETLTQAGAMRVAARDYLLDVVAQRKNIFVCGGTGSGKTSLLGALIHAVDPGDRIICLEDIAEIQSGHPHFLQMEARPANQEGEGEQNLRRLLRESLRMRPDRLVIGECRGPEAVDLLMALNTGHAGSMGTIHANSARDALARLELLALMGAENLRDQAAKALVASAVQVIVFLERDERGRRVSGISELRGVDGGTYLMREVRPGSS